MTQIRKIFILTRPVQLVFVLLAYGLGLGLARYLGATIYPEPQFFGGVIVVLMVAASNLLVAYFQPPNEPVIPDETRKEREELRTQILVISLSFMATIAILEFFLSRGGFIKTESGFILAIFTFLALANAVPPIRLENRGLGEISTSIQIASLTPGLAFLLQFGSLNRLLLIFTFPLLLLAITYFLAMNFPAYPKDMKYEHKSLLTSLTWQRAIPLHNALIIASYLFFAATPFFGVPFGLVWPALLTLPIAAFQVYSLRNMADGAKPAWSIFIATSTAVYGLTLYLIALTFWLR